jgi:hypothetical protein
LACLMGATKLAMLEGCISAFIVAFFIRSYSAL